MGASYLGGYIRDDDSKHDWLRNRTLMWEKKHHSGTWNQIRVDLSSAHHLGNGRRVRGSGENNLGNLFASSFILKDENPLSHRRISKYDAGQETRNGTPEPSDFGIGEVLKFPAGERGTGLGRDRRRGIIQCRPPTDSKWRQTWHKERLGRHVQIQTQGFSKQPQRCWKAPTPTCQKHRFLTECTRYYIFRYSTIWYGILGFSMCT